MTSLTGQCLCGAVRFTANSLPSGARMCWCRDCQRIASGSATVNVLFAESDVIYAGAVATYEMVADSGNTVCRGFCPTCGAQLYSKTVAGPSQPMRVRAGTLDDPRIAPPTAVIWASRAPAWAVFDPAMPLHGEGPGSPLVAR